MTNRYKFHARKSDTQNMETHQKGDQNRTYKNEKNIKNKPCEQKDKQKEVKNLKPERSLWRQETL